MSHSVKINHSPFLSPPPLSTKEKIVEWLGRVWVRILHFPQNILSILLQILGKEPLQLIKKPLPNKVSQTYFEDLTQIFHETHPAQHPTQSKKNHSLIPGETFEKALEEGLSSLFPEITEESFEKKVSDLLPEVIKQDSANPTPPIVELSMINSEAEIIFTDSIIDVPDNGDCLFSAIAVGIKLTYNQFAITSKLNWNINPTILEKDLSTQELLLKEPGYTLRTQAVNYLQLNLEAARIALFASIIDHNEIIQKKIKETEEAKEIVKQDIELLENDPSNNSEELKDKKEHLSHQLRSIQELENQIIEYNDVEEYLAQSSRAHFFCGTAHIFALASEYKIPIEVIFDFGLATEKKEIFNPSESSLPNLTLAYVNGNHFKFIRRQDHPFG
jgi:hypothetical protein